MILRKTNALAVIGAGGWGGGGERRGLGPRNDALTTCKAVNPRTSQRSFKSGGMFSHDFKF